MIPILLERCPGFAPAWQKHREEWGQKQAGIYNDLAKFVHFLVKSYGQGETDSFPAVFEAVEVFIVEGDEDRALRQRRPPVERRAPGAERDRVTRRLQEAAMRLELRGAHMQSFERHRVLGPVVGPDGVIAKHRDAREAIPLESMSVSRTA